MANPNLTPFSSIICLLDQLLQIEKSKENFITESAYVEFCSSPLATSAYP